MTTPSRVRLPNRRRAETRELTIGNLTLTATVGFDQAGRPAEVFLCGAKDGSGLAAILDDASVMPLGRRDQLAWMTGHYGVPYLFFLRSHAGSAGLTDRHLSLDFDDLDPVKRHGPHLRDPYPYPSCKQRLSIARSGQQSHCGRDAFTRRRKPSGQCQDDA